MMTPSEKARHLELLKQGRNLRANLEMLTNTVIEFVAYLDAEMKMPSTVERGRRIAKIRNALVFNNDRARHFGLGISFKSLKWKRLPKGELEIDLAAVKEELLREMEP